MIHRKEIRVYYEDTDMAGIVYYANYLRYIERGRSEWVRDVGLDQNQMKDRDGIVFAVRRVEADYLVPAKLDDELVVHTWVETLKPVRMVMGQEVRRGETVPLRVVALRRDGYGGEIELRVQQPPAGLRAAPATIREGKSDALLLLTAETNAPLFAGELNITGHAKIAGQEIARALAASARAACSAAPARSTAWSICAAVRRIMMIGRKRVAPAGAGTGLVTPMSRSKITS